MKLGFAMIITVLITLCSWVAHAFQFQWTKTTKKSSSFYRSVSGLLRSSSQALSSLAPSIPLRGREMNMISSHHVYTEPKANFWPFNFFTSNSNATPTLRQLKQADEIMRNYKASAEAASSSLKPMVKGVHVAGYMDYDPKIAAKNAYRMASIRRDSSWFHL